MLPTTDIEVTGEPGRCDGFVIATSDGPNKVIEGVDADGDGAADPISSVVPEDVAGADDSRDATVIDVDGDGRPDAVFGGADGTATAVLNDSGEGCCFSGAGAPARRCRGRQPTSLAAAPSASRT